MLYCRHLASCNEEPHQALYHPMMGRCLPSEAQTPSFSPTVDITRISLTWSIPQG